MKNRRYVMLLLTTPFLVGCGSKGSNDSPSLEDRVQEEKKDVLNAETALEKERLDLAKAELVAQQERLKKDQESLMEIQATNQKDKDFKSKVDPFFSAFTRGLQNAITRLGANVTQRFSSFNAAYHVTLKNISEIERILEDNSSVIASLGTQLSEVERVTNSNDASSDIKLEYQQLLRKLRSEYIQVSQNISDLKGDKINFERQKEKLLSDLIDKLDPRAGGYGFNKSLVYDISQSQVQGYKIFKIKEEDRSRLLIAFQDFLKKPSIKELVLKGDRQAVMGGLLNVFKVKPAYLSSFKPKETFKVHQQSGKFGEYENPYSMNGARYLDFQYIKTTSFEIAPGIITEVLQTAEGFVRSKKESNELEIRFYDGAIASVSADEWASGVVYLGGVQRQEHVSLFDRCLINKKTGELLYSSPFMELINIYNADGSLTIYGKALQNIMKKTLEKDSVLEKFWLPVAGSQALAAGITPSTMSRLARQGTAGVDASQLQLNGVSAGKVEMSLPISINLKGKIDGSKSTAGTSGTVAYKMGNAVVGIVHAYANKGEGFEGDSHQSETSVALSQSMGNAFVEGQVGYIGTHHVHNADMIGHRYQLSMGFDTEYISPFVQLAYRDFGKQTDASAYVGAEMAIDSLKADTYSLDTHLTAKAGVDSKTEFTGSLEWSASLNLNSGISFKTDLTLGTVEGSTFGMTANISR